MLLVIGVFVVVQGATQTPAVHVANSHSEGDPQEIPDFFLHWPAIQTLFESLHGLFASQLLRQIPELHENSPHDFGAGALHCPAPLHVAAETSPERSAEHIAEAQMTPGP